MKIFKQKIKILNWSTMLPQDKSIDELLKKLSEKGVATYYTILYRILYKKKLIRVRKKTFLNYALNYFSLSRNYFLTPKLSQKKITDEKEIEKVIDEVVKSEG